MHHGLQIRGFYGGSPASRHRGFCARGVSCQGESHLGGQQLALFSPEAARCLAKWPEHARSSMTIQQTATSVYPSALPLSDFHVGSCPHPTSQHSRDSAPDFQTQSRCLRSCVLRGLCLLSPTRPCPLPSRPYLCLLSLPNTGH